MRSPKECHGLRSINIDSEGYLLPTHTVITRFAAPAEGINQNQSPMQRVDDIIDARASKTQLGWKRDVANGPQVVSLALAKPPFASISLARSDIRA